MIRRLRRLTASSSLGGTGGIHGMLVGTSVALITRSITAARTAYVVSKEADMIHFRSQTIGRFALRRVPSKNAATFCSSIVICVILVVMDILTLCCTLRGPN